MKYLICILFIWLCASPAQAQKKTRAWVTVVGHESFNLGGSSGSTLTRQSGTIRWGFRFEAERDLLRKERSVLSLNGTWMQSSVGHLSSGGASKYSINTFQLWGGGIGLRHSVHDFETGSLMICNVTNWFYARDSFQALTKHKNFLESRFGAACSLKLNEKRCLWTRVTYNLLWDMKYPEPFNGLISRNTTTISIGLDL